MLEWINNTISLETLIWLFPITFMLHDFEEIITVESWFKKNYVKVSPRIPTSFKKIFEELSHTTAARFTIPVFFQFIIYVIASLIAVEYEIYGPFIGVNLIIFLHVFMHIGQSIFLKVYALGVGSAIFITLPYSLYLFYRFMTEGIIDGYDLLINAPYGLLTVGSLVIGHDLAKKIFK